MRWVLTSEYNHKQKPFWAQLLKKDWLMQNHLSYSEKSLTVFSRVSVPTLNPLDVYWAFCEQKNDFSKILTNFLILSWFLNVVFVLQVVISCVSLAYDVYRRIYRLRKEENCSGGYFYSFSIFKSYFKLLFLTMNSILKSSIVLIIFPV